MLAGKLALVVGSIVQLHVMSLYAIKKEVAGLLQEGVDGKIKRLEIGRQRVAGDIGVSVERSQAWWECELALLLCGLGWQLV